MPLASKIHPLHARKHPCDRLGVLSAGILGGCKRDRDAASAGVVFWDANLGSAADTAAAQDYIKWNRYFNDKKSLRGADKHVKHQLDNPGDFPYDPAMYLVRSQVLLI
jgi:hypothetical protein